MAERRAGLGRSLLVGVLLLSLAACVRPVGDFGRPAPSVVHDRLLPGIGEGRARMAGEPISRFNQTDAEVEMHNRIWRFLVSQRNQDWSFDFAAEMKRTRIGPDAGMTFNTDRYYRWLHGTEFASSAVRYNRMLDDIRADLATLPTTFASICAVLEVDRRRIDALDAVGRGDRRLAEDTAARRAENDISIGWFVAALTFRAQSYDYALDHLLVETPHQEARAVDARIGELSDYVAAARRRDFCFAGRVGRGIEHSGIRPRVLMSAPSEGEFRK